LTYHATKIIFIQHINEIIATLNIFFRTIVTDLINGISVI